MNKFSIRVFLIFFLFFTLAYALVAYFYQRVSKNFMEQNRIDYVASMSKSASFAVESRIEQDLEWLRFKIDNYQDMGENYADHLDELSIHSVPVVGYGKVADTLDAYVIEGIRYYYTNTDLSDTYVKNDFNDYEQLISFYSFKDGFKGYDKLTKFIFFNIGNQLLFYEAHPYLKDVIQDEYMTDNYYFLISKDASIHYKKEIDSPKDKLFDDYIRGANSELLIAQMTSALYSLQEGTYQIRFMGKSAYLTFYPLTPKFSIRQYFVAYIFFAEDVTSDISYLRITLFTFYLIISLLFICLGLVVYFILNKKNSDVELSLFRYYYLKPYSFKTNRKGKIVSYNKSLKINFPAIARYKHLRDIVEEEDQEGIKHLIGQQMPITLMVNNSDGQKRTLRFFPVKLLFNYLYIGEDITEFQMESIRNSRLALYNRVTDLPNSIILQDSLQKILDRKEESLKCAFVVMDIVQFRNYNNFLGRKIADTILVKMGEIINANLRRPSDTLYHLEGDLFGVLMHEIDHERSITDWCQNLNEILRKPVQFGTYSLTLKLKMGIVNFKDLEDGATAATVIEEAEQALKRAKEFPNLSFAIFDEGMKKFYTHEQVMENDLRKAIENREFVMFLQPQYDNSLNRIVAFEALIRWDNPKYRLSSPAHFIEVAEQNNLIIEIGRIVTEETFKMAKILEPYKVRISMNLSPIQLMQAGFVKEFVEAFKEMELPEGSIAIEITENFLMTNLENIIDKMYILKNNGFSLHLDDFGTGYSSMLYLKDLPIDTIKIDREFIRYLNTDKYSRAIVPKLISLAKSLDLGVIAEGVENEKQNQFLIKNGCNVIQGHLISKAIPLDQAIRLLDERFTLEKKN